MKYYLDKLFINKFTINNEIEIPKRGTEYSAGLDIGLINELTINKKYLTDNKLNVKICSRSSIFKKGYYVKSKIENDKLTYSIFNLTDEDNIYPIYNIKQPLQLLCYKNINKNYIDYSKYLFNIAISNK